MAYQGLNQVKPSGQPCDVYREQLQLNTASYGGNDSDDYRFNSTISGLPARTSHVPDTTAYAVNGIRTDNWGEHMRGKQGVAADTSNNDI